MTDAIKNQMEFNRVHSEWMQARSELRRAECGNVASPYQSDRTPFNDMQSLEMKVIRSRSLVKSHPHYPEHVKAVQAHRDQVRKPYEPAIAKLNAEMDNLIDTLDALPLLGRVNPSKGSMALRDAINILRAETKAYDLNHPRRESPAELTRFEMALEVHGQALVDGRKVNMMMEA